MFNDGWGLSLIIFLPAVGAGVVMAIPKAKEQLLKLAALGFAGASFILSILLAIDFDYSNAGEFQADTAPDTVWIGAINSHFHIGVDGICLLYTSPSPRDS